MTEEQLDQIVLRIFGSDGKKTLKDALVGLLPSGMIPVILRLAGLAETERIAAITKSKRLDIVRTLKDLTLTVSKLRPLKEAQVTAGGLNSEEIDPRVSGVKTCEGSILRR